MTDAQRVKVKRDGPRGWHWIAAHHFDPAVHQLVDEPPAPSPAAAPAQAPAPADPAKRRGRPPKNAT